MPEELRMNVVIACAVPVFVRFKAFRISLREIASGHSLFDLLRQNCHQLSRTERSNFGSDGDLATLTRYDATAFAETGGLENRGGR